MDSYFSQKTISDRINRIIRILFFRLSGKKPGVLVACGEEKMGGIPHVAYIVATAVRRT